MNYGDIIALSSHSLLSATFWGVAYFIVLLSPLFVYIRESLKDDKARAVMIYEVMGAALLLQIGALTLFLFLGTFLTHINVGVNHLRPESALKIFFGSGGDTLTERWDGYLSQSMSDNSIKGFGNEAKGVSFLLNKYIGLIYEFFMLLLFFAFMIFSLLNFTRQFHDGESVNLFQKLYSTFVTMLFIVLATGIHSIIAKALPVAFGIPDTTLSIDFIPYFQKVIALTFYD